MYGFGILADLLGILNLSPPSVRGAIIEVLLSLFRERGTIGKLAAALDSLVVGDGQGSCPFNSSKWNAFYGIATWKVAAAVCSLFDPQTSLA